MSTLEDIRPIFIKANISFSLGEQHYFFPGVGVSLFGVTSLTWKDFDPLERLGQRVNVNVDVLASKKTRLFAAAELLAEQGMTTNYLGLRFLLTADQKNWLQNVIASEGYYPTEYIRKYPRIPALATLNEMPLRAIAEWNFDVDGEPTRRTSHGGHAGEGAFGTARRDLRAGGGRCIDIARHASEESGLP
jgi:hypothetical protein